MQKFSTPLLVAAVAMIAPGGRVLMQRRRLGAAHGGLWEFPGGKIEPGETPEAAASRELGEELGIAVDPGALAPLTFASGPAASPEAGPGLVILLYICRDWRGDPQCHEGEELAWFAPAGLGALAMPPLDYPLARALTAALPD